MPTLSHIKTPGATVETDSSQDGLANDQLEELLLKYQAFSNCPLKPPPRVNPEIKASLSESSLTRDSRLLASQNRLCSALSSIGSALSILFSEELEEPKCTVIKLINDVAKLIVDVHYEQSQALDC
ncbi:unnamed protein product [Brassicogethes aeneus]|uniref:Uncharacterized protein n=1 Tax=Brassicogethes aeneus TaxID=1431903 RepID=A0A9P0AWG0_BRAAE|nr:unnamed protein product [Brassicogethes aeneus]